MTEAINAVLDFLYRLMITCIDLVADLVCGAVDAVLGVITEILSGFSGVADLVGISSIMSSLPTGFTNAMYFMGLPSCMGMLVTALGIRAVLQLIPFVRLGS